MSTISNKILFETPRLVGLVVSVSASHAVGHGFAPRPGHTKDHHKNGTNCLLAWNACNREGVCQYSLTHHPSTVYDEKTTRVPVLSHQTTRVKTYHLSAKREGDEFFTEGGLVNEKSNEGGFLFIMNLKR